MMAKFRNEVGVQNIEPLLHFDNSSGIEILCNFFRDWNPWQQNRPCLWHSCSSWVTNFSFSLLAPCPMPLAITPHLQTRRRRHSDFCFCLLQQSGLHIPFKNNYIISQHIGHQQKFTGWIYREIAWMISIRLLVSEQLKHTRLLVYAKHCNAVFILPPVWWIQESSVRWNMDIRTSIRWSLGFAIPKYPL